MRSYFEGVALRGANPTMRLLAMTLVASWTEEAFARTLDAGLSRETSAGCVDEIPEWDLAGSSPIPCDLGPVLLEIPEQCGAQQISGGIGVVTTRPESVVVRNFLIFMGVWAAAAIGMALMRHFDKTKTARFAECEAARALFPQVRDGRWDRARFHLMTCIIWSHWLGKWGLQATKPGWACLNCVFTFHVTGFVLISGTFCAKYARSAAYRGLMGQRRVFMGCLDLFLVYIIFSWLRGIGHLSFGTQSTFGIIETTIRGTFLFHQGPWYLAALIMWRCSSFLLVRLPFPVALVIALLLSALCPYKALAAAQDPLALREFLHYMPFFVVGLFLGQDGLERITCFAGDRSVMFAAAILTTLAFLVWFPLGFLYDGSKELMWVLLMKGVPPVAAGGVLAMIVLYSVKFLATVCALTLFSVATTRSVDRVVEAAGQRSMLVYMVHMVFVMVPGEDLCVREYLALVFSESVAAQATVLLVVAVAVNLLCGSSFTDMFFRPLVEPLKFVEALRNWQQGEKPNDEGDQEEAQAFVTEANAHRLPPKQVSTPQERARW